MAKAIRLSRELNENGVTLIDNAFIYSYMTEASGDAVKVYLYGLAASNRDNTIEDIALEMGLDVVSITKIYDYWREQGLVRIISDSPFMVEYLPVGGGNRYLKKYKPEKYEEFNKDLQDLFPEQHLTPNKFLGFIDIIEEYKMQPNAMLLITKYCVNYKSGRVHTNYVLAVAKDWATSGILTVKDVDKRLKEIEVLSEVIREVFVALKLKSAPDISDKELYIKWTKSWGYDHESIVFVAGTVKRGGMSKLDSTLDKYYRKGIFTLEAIKEQKKYIEKAHDTALAVLKNLGIYYENIEPVIDVYISAWFDKGFDSDAIILLAKYAFKRGIKSLETMDNIIGKFYKLGYINVKGINEYIGLMIEKDNRIKALIALTGSSRRVSEADRQFYDTWNSVWGFEQDMLECAARVAVGKAHPFQYMNATLSRWKNEGIDTVERAESAAASMVAASTTNKAGKGVADKSFGTAREYSKEELEGVFGDPDDIDNFLNSI